MTEVEKKLVSLISHFLDEIDRETDYHMMNEIAESGCDHTPEYYAASTELRQFMRELEKYNKGKKR